MSNSVGTIDLGLDVNSNSFNKQLKGISKNSESSVKSAFSGIGKMIGAAIGIAAVTSFTKSCLELGSNLTEVQNVVDTVFPSMNSQVNDFSKNAMEQFGLSETVAKQYIGTLGAMSKSMGMSEAKAYEMSSSIAGLSGDVASFYNLSSDEAYTKLKGIWTGETEGLKELGVVMTQANLDQYALKMGYGQTTSAMTEQMKLMLRYQYVTSSLSAAQGDFAKTSDSWANQVRVLGLRFDSLKATLGQGLINVFTPLIGLLNKFVASLQRGADAFKSFTDLVTGNEETGSTLSSISSTAESLSENIDGIGSSAKDTLKQLAGFDKITKLGEETTSTGSTGSTASADVDTNQGTTSADSNSKAYSSLKKEMSGFLSWANNNFSGTFQSIWKGLSRETKEFKNTLGKVFSDIKSLGKPLAAYFKGPFTKMLSKGLKSAGKIAVGLFDSFNMKFNDIWDEVVFPVSENFIKVALPMLTEYHTETLKLLAVHFNELKKIGDMTWSEGIKPALGLLTQIWISFINTVAEFWNKWGQPIFDALAKAIVTTGSIFQTLWETIMQPIWNNLMTVVDEVWTDHLQPLVANFLDFVGVFITGAAEIYDNFIAPIVKMFAKIFGPGIISVFNTIGNVIGTVFGTVFDMANSFITVFKGIAEFFKGIFTGDIKLALKGIYDVFKGVFDGLVTVVKTPINLIIDVINGLVSGVVSGINTVIDAINSLSFDVPDWIPGIGGETFGFDLSKIKAPQIPKLAQGGYVKANAPQLAMIGDNRHQGEVVAPEDKLKQMARDVMSEGNSRGYDLEILLILKEILKALKELNVDLVIDGKKLKDIIVDKINQNTKQTGVCEIMV